MYGLEILAACYGNVSCNESHTQWEEFFSSLKHNGYFENEIEGSMRYQSLLKTAKEYYNELTYQEVNRCII